MADATAYPSRLTPYHILGLPSTAGKEQVKDAFRKLCLKYHPDKCDPAIPKAVAEAKFRDIKAAYDQILKGQAGYAPPPPGSKPSAAYARAWYKAHHGGMDFEGPIRCGGPFGGFATERDFYKSMFRTSRNNPFVLIMTGLASIPVIAAAVSVANGKTEFIEQFKNEGIFMFTQNRMQVNGRDTLRANPFSIRSNSGKDSREDLYIYKDPRYAHLRKGLATASPAAPSEAS